MIDGEAPSWLVNIDVKPYKDDYPDDMVALRERVSLSSIT